MTRDQLRALLNGHEDGFVERKTAGHQSDVVATLVAFANSVPVDREAVLFIGVRDDGVVTGVENPDKLQKNVFGWARDVSFPPIRVQCEVLDNVGTKPVVAVVVTASNERPHFAGPAYVRVGSQSIKASQEVLDDLIASRNSKAGAILRHKGEVVAVDMPYKTWPTLGWGRSGFTTDDPPVRRSTSEYRIEGCTAFSVQLTELASGNLTSISLDRVQITTDPKRQRPLMLRVSAEE